MRLGIPRQTFRRLGSAWLIDLVLAGLLMATGLLLAFVVQGVIPAP